MDSFIKWVGGKKRLFNQIIKYKPKEFNKYIEPFVGGGYVFLNINHHNCLINDINKSLVNVYMCIKDNLDDLIKELDKLKDKEKDYYFIRDQEKQKGFSNLSNTYKAARFIYLNKNCFNGMYRENSKGFFNVPKGRYKKINLYNKENLLNINKMMNHINLEITNLDYKHLINKINKNDFVYLDPPYDPIDKTKSFTQYNKDNFDKNNQTELKEFCDQINKKGAFFMLSNNQTDFIKELYKKYEITTVISTFSFFIYIILHLLLNKITFII